MLYREIIAVDSEIRTKHINALCGQNVEFFLVFKLVVNKVTTKLWVKIHDVKTYGGVEVQRHSLAALSLDAGEWPISHLGLCVLWETPPRHTWIGYWAHPTQSLTQSPVCPAICLATVTVHFQEMWNSLTLLQCRHFVLCRDTKVR